MSIIFSATPWPTNSHMILDCWRLGYLPTPVLDPTYGLGNWWNNYRSSELVTGDLHTNAMVKLDFCHLPFADNVFGAVAYDGPYKLNGTPTEYVDNRYGVGKTVRWQDRMGLLRTGFVECARVVRTGGYLLAKCQDQVCSGKIRWQTDMLSGAGYGLGMRKVDELVFLNQPRPQSFPQKHSRRNYSTLLVFQKV
jgi:hypothetical protein